MKNFVKKINKDVMNKNLSFQKFLPSSFSLINNFKTFSTLNKNVRSNISVLNNESFFDFDKRNNKAFSYPRHKKLLLPSLSPSMETGSIKEWLKKEGDAYLAGESIAAIETDKATVDYELNDDGFIAKILKPEGSTNIPIGEVSVY